MGFLNLGIPTSGIFTGAGAPTDPCYHLACDTIKNIHWEALTVNTKAAGSVAAQLALSLDDVPPRGKKSSYNADSPLEGESLQKPLMLETDDDVLHVFSHMWKNKA